jgi:hypothetical protein
MTITQSYRLGDFYHKQDGVGYLPQYGGEQYGDALIPLRSFKSFDGDILMQIPTFRYGDTR